MGMAVAAFDCQKVLIQSAFKSFCQGGVLFNTAFHTSHKRCHLLKIVPIAKQGWCYRETRDGVYVYVRVCQNLCCVCVCVLEY